MAGSVQAACVVQVNNIQRMIDINASNLDGLRTQCTSTSDLIQQEIRDQEGKLVKLFSRMLLARQKIEAECINYLDYHQYPRLGQWLHVVGIGSYGVKALVEKYGSFGSLLAAPEDSLRGFLVESNASSEDTWKLTSALNHLRDFTEQRKDGKNASSSNTFSWSFGKDNQRLNSTSSSSQSSVTGNEELPLTPGSDQGLGQASAPKRFPKPLGNMKRSKSDELACKPKFDSVSLSPGGSLGKNKGRGLWVEIPHSGSLEPLNGEKSDDMNFSYNNNFSSSPKTPTRINLGDKHSFSQKHLMIGGQCYICMKQIFRGVKCKKCGLKFHKGCCKDGIYGCGFVQAQLSLARNNRNYSSLPYRFRRWKRTNSEPENIANRLNNTGESDNHSFNSSHLDLYQNTIDHRRRGYNEPPTNFSYGAHLISSNFPIDVASMSSTASTPQPSPPGTINNPMPASAPPQGDAYGVYDRRLTSSRSTRRRKGLGIFLFPGDLNSFDSDTDLTRTSTALVVTESLQLGQSTMTVESNDSTLSGGDTPTVDSLESQISDYDSLTRTWSSKRWERDSHLSEWTIPFNDIDLQDLIGVGRIGKVFRGNWHGQVAVKVIEIQQPTPTQLQAFKMQVQTFRKTRHENLVLFMGACMEPPQLAIITSLCKDSHLYKRIHVFKETLPVIKVMLILKQIAQGMSYLHSRGIVHADLKSKNIFFENDSKVVITDFGHLRLAAGLSVEKTRPGRVKIPYGWLNYLAPEIIRSLSPHEKLIKKIFTKDSDVYAFGDYPLETKIYKIGKGAKQSLSKLDVVREMKDLINQFWAYHPGKRPNFKIISKILDKIPVTKGRLYRSPSQPVTHMLRSECFF